jgi:hypothetical protein
VYSVEVHTDLILPDSRNRITRYLVFETYPDSLSCINCLLATKSGKYSPEDYFEAAKISRDPVGKVVGGHSIQSDFVLTYLQKTC